MALSDTLHVHQSMITRRLPDRLFLVRYLEICLVVRFLNHLTVQVLQNHRLDCRNQLHHVILGDRHYDSKVLFVWHKKYAN